MVEVAYEKCLTRVSCPILVQFFFLTNSQFYESFS